MNILILTILRMSFVYLYYSNKGTFHFCSKLQLHVFAAYLRVIKDTAITDGSMTYGCFLKPTYLLIRHTNDLQAIQLTIYLRRRNIIKGFGSIKNGRIFQFDDNEDKRNLHERKNDSSIKIVTDNSDAFLF